MSHLPPLMKNLSKIKYIYIYILYLYIKGEFSFFFLKVDSFSGICEETKKKFSISTHLDQPSLVASEELPLACQRLSWPARVF